MINSGRQIVDVVGQPQVFSAAPMRVGKVIIHALRTNTSLVAVGDQRVRATVDYEEGILLWPDQEVELSNIDLSQLYLDVRVAAEGVRWFSDDSNTEPTTASR